jgi:hypothetical protein
MGLQSEAIESRLEGLKLDDRRMMFDSKLRAFRRESKSQATAANLASKPDGLDEPGQSMGQVILLLEDLSRRIEGLEKKNRGLGEEIRHRGREDRRWRSVSLAGGLAISAFLYLGGLLRWF